MSVLETILNAGSRSLEKFISENVQNRIPFASAATAKHFVQILSWNHLEDILSLHGDCWLVRNGKLCRKQNGHVDIEDAIRAFEHGATLLVRLSEKVSRAIALIASDFFSVFQKPIDVQIYITPSNEEGFDWHFDIEDVFVFQTHGKKEFALVKNKMRVHTGKVILPKNCGDLEKQFDGPETRCLLHAGDWLYIPAGCWHKARALEDSFHFSVGVRRYAVATNI